MVTNRTRGVYLMCVYGHFLLTQACYWAVAGVFHALNFISLTGPDTPPYFLYSEIITSGVVLAATFIRERNQLITTNGLLASRAALKSPVSIFGSGSVAVNVWPWMNRTISVLKKKKVLLVPL